VKLVPDLQSTGAQDTRTLVLCHVWSGCAFALGDFFLLGGLVCRFERVGCSGRVAGHNDIICIVGGGVVVIEIFLGLIVLLEVILLVDALIASTKGQLSSPVVAHQELHGGSVCSPASTAVVVAEVRHPERIKCV
jgi:hypothetical protein